MKCLACYVLNDVNSHHKQMLKQLKQQAPKSSFFGACSYLD